MHQKDFNDLDTKLDKMNFLYKDIDLTYIVRNHIVSLIRSKENSGNVQISINGKVLLRFFLAGLKTFLSLFKTKNTWVFSNAERRKNFGGFYYDRVGSLVSHNDDDVLFVENPALVQHKKPCNDTILSDAIFYLFSYIIGFVCFRINRMTIDKSVYTYAQEVDITINFVPLIRRFYGQYVFMNLYLQYVSKPKKVFSVYPNGYYGYNYAFKKFNIPIIELQHGIIYALHPSYNTILFEKSEIFKPDYIFTYGTKDKECLDALNYVKSKNIYVVGSYGLWKLKNAKDTLSSYITKRIKTENKIVLIVATANDIDEMYSFALAFEKINTDYRLLVLPRHQANHLTDTQNVKILDTKDTNIFETYRVASYVLTKASTSALEALFLGIPTFILNANGNTFFKDNYGFLNSLNYLTSLKDFENKLVEKNYVLPSFQDVEKLFSTNVIENFNTALKAIDDK